MSKKDFINLDKDIEKIIRASEKNIIKGYNDSLKYLKNEMANLYEKHSVDGKLTSDAMNKYNRIKALEKDIAITVTMLYQVNNKEIAKTLRKSFIDTSKSIVSIVEKDIGRSLKPILKAVDVNKTINADMKGLKWVERQGKHRADLIYDINKTVKEGISNGETYKNMAKRLEKEIIMSRNKAVTIVRTETSRVVATSQKDTLDKVNKAGIWMMKTWNNVNDERVRGNRASDKMDHVAMGGITIPYEDDFVLPDGAKGFGPKLTGSYNDINCRCFLTISFKED